MAEVYHEDAGTFSSNETLETKKWMRRIELFMFKKKVKLPISLQETIINEIAYFR